MLSQARKENLKRDQKYKEEANKIDETKSEVDEVQKPKLE